MLLFDANGKKVRQVLWGDFLNVIDETADGRFKIIWGPNGPNPRELFIPVEDTQEERPLEIIFVDVGQGDGAVLVTSEVDTMERIIVIDAGEGDNMLQFLNARFRSTGIDFADAIITHPDTDHYKGFQRVFEDGNIEFANVYQNGLVERPTGSTWTKLGGRSPEDANGRRYLSDLALDRSAIERHFGAPTTFGQFEFAPVMGAALANPNTKFAMLSHRHGTIENGQSYLPGFAPSDGRPYTIEVIGPVVEFDGTTPRLRTIGGFGETKNGHSVLLKLVFGEFTVLFGGDLNDKAEKYLLAHYAGLDEFPKKTAGIDAETLQDQLDAMIETARTTFGADIMKVCHHGSEKVTDEFLQTVHPACFVISSGDDESHVHPRPDLLGRLGRHGRGHAPVLLSTELQRSTREREAPESMADLGDEIDALVAATLTGADASAIRATITAKIRKLARTNVEVYGAIYLKTDGENLITAFRIETDSDIKRWFYFEYQLVDGELVLVDA